MKTKTYNIVKQAVVGNTLEKAMAVSVTSTSYRSALESVGALFPVKVSQHAGVCIFRDQNNWTYLICIG